MSGDEDTYEIPLQDQRIFGAGIKRKRVKFVPSSNTVSNPTPPPSNSSAKSVSERYLDLVLPKEKPNHETPSSSTSKISNLEQAQENTASEVCEICNLPLTTATHEPNPLETSSASSPSSSTPKPPQKRPHEASIAHQVCLTHSHPPSHLDRTRKGLAYLSAYGWDPDARLGLGATGQGIQFPVKTKPKDDKLGIGVVVPKDTLRGKRLREKQVKLDAGKVRKLEARDKRKMEKLREMFYRSEDVERYLGGG